MSNHIHLNLIKEEEIVSSSPIRTQVIAPFVLIIIAISILSWWLLLLMQYSNAKSLNTRNLNIQEQLQASYKKVMTFKAEERNLTALLAQLKAYEKSKNFYGKSLALIPAHVLPNIQFTKLELLKPAPPLLEKVNPSKGPTNITEIATFVISGRTSGAKAFDAVNQLLNGLKKAPFTNLIQSAQIPKGSFRQDLAYKNKGEFLRFELECNCTPRRFE
ncbi:MAG: hypothetical protein PF904_02610 [Kiritimatiellae bacterium]|jgi:hypothetical protein|nr:hypothetical protein [Kiritimatiellia bacterium]